jgi:hypothetical protein
MRQQKDTSMEVVKKCNQRYQWLLLKNPLDVTACCQSSVARLPHTWKKTIKIK